MSHYIFGLDGAPTARLRDLLPDTALGENPSDAALEALNVYRAVVTQPVLTRYQQRGAEIRDTEARPVTITWTVASRPNAEIWALHAADRKRREAERALRDTGTDVDTLQRKLDAVRYLAGLETL